MIGSWWSLRPPPTGHSRHRFASLPSPGWFVRIIRSTIPGIGSRTRNVGMAEFPQDLGERHGRGANVKAKVAKQPYKAQPFVDSSSTYRRLEHEEYAQRQMIRPNTQ